MGNSCYGCGDYWDSHFQDVVVIPVVSCCHLLLIATKQLSKATEYLMYSQDLRVIITDLYIARCKLLSRGYMAHLHKATFICNNVIHLKASLQFIFIFQVMT